MTEIEKQIMAKIKAFDIIKSCVTGSHFSVAEKYIDLYYVYFEDFYGYNELRKELSKILLENT